MITSRTWTMTITGMLRSPVLVFLTIASCVAGAPLQLEGENIGLGQAVYSQPELAAALARTYEALESQEKSGEDEISARNLDHIGGGNLLRDVATENSDEEDNVFKRNLDHIGGGNLLRDLEAQTFGNSRVVRDQPSNQFGATKRPGLADGFKDDPSKWAPNRGTLDSLGGGNSVRRRDTSSLNEFKRNLDHIGGGNLLRDLESQSFGNSRVVRDQPSNQFGATKRPGLADGFKDDSSKWAPNRGTLDSLGGGNSVRRRDTSSLNEFKRNLDHIGGGNLLRDLESQSFGNSRVVRDQPSNQFGATKRPGLADGFKDDPSKWAPNRGTLDSLGGGNSVRRRETSSLNEFKRNLDHIGGGNLLRDLESQAFGSSRVVRDEQTVNQQISKPNSTRRPGLAAGFQDDHSQWSPNRGTLDSLGGGNDVGRRDTSSSNQFELERNLDHIGGGNLLRDLATDDFDNLLRDLDSQRSARLSRSEPFTIEWDNRKYRTTLKPDLLEGFKDDPSTWAPNRGTLDSIGGAHLIGREPDPRTLNAIGAGHLMRQSRRGLDSLSGATFGESKRWDPPRKQNEPSTQNSNWPNIMNRMQFDSSAKRNFDEIDRTNFDSFVKRNLDEIDRTGWDSFVKRRSMNAYLASRQR